MALRYDINRLNSIYLVYLVFCLFVSIALSTKLVKPNDSNNGWAISCMWLNVVNTILTFFMGRKALKTKDERALRKFGWCILSFTIVQTGNNYDMLVNLAHMDGIAQIAQTDTFKLAYFITFLVITGYQLFVAILAIHATPRPRTEPKV